MYLFHSTIKICVYIVICFIISGMLYIQEIWTEEIEENLFKDKILEVLAEIPQSSDNIHLGPLRIHPSLKISETNDDNIFYTPQGSAPTLQDFYETYEPEISLELPLRKHLLNFDYGFEILDYNKSYNPSVNEQDRVNRNWGGSADLNFGNGFSILLSDRVKIRRIPGRFTRRDNRTVIDPVDEQTDGDVDGEETLEQFGFNIFTLSRQFTVNEISIEIDLPDYFNRFDFILGYSNKDSSYKQRSFGSTNDQNTNIFNGNIKIALLPKVNIKTGIQYSDFRYDKNFINDSNYREIPFEISWKASSKSYLFLNTSYNRRDYGRRSIFANFTGYDAALGYRFNVTKNDNLLIKLERSLVEQQFMRDPDNTAQGDNNPQEWTQINMDYTHEFPGNFSATLSPAIQRRSFQERQDVLSDGGGIVRKHQHITAMRLEVNAMYTAPSEWLSGEISYRYIDVRSNVLNGDLIKNELQISLGLSF